MLGGYEPISRHRILTEPLGPLHEVCRCGPSNTTARDQLVEGAVELGPKGIAGAMRSSPTIRGGE